MSARDLFFVQSPCEGNNINFKSAPYEFLNICLS